MEMLPDQDTLRSLVQHAVLAPSSHNTQPWLFHIEDRAVQLHADPSRALQVNDPEGRELLMSCGCALFNLRVAATHAGWSYNIQMFPDPERPDYLARFELDEDELSCDLSPLFDALLLRRTYRNRFQKRQPTEDVLSRLGEVAKLEGACLTQVEEKCRDAVIDLVREGDNRQWQNEDWRKELAEWLHGSRKGDGLAVPGLVAPLVRGVVRRFDMGKSVASQDDLLASESPLLLLLSTREDSRDAWVRAGQALQRLLLEAQLEGLQASYLNQPIQVQALRPQLQALFDSQGHPQMLMRMGYPEETLTASPRRPVEDVIRA